MFLLNLFVWGRVFRLLCRKPIYQTILHLLWHLWPKREEYTYFGYLCLMIVISKLSFCFLEIVLEKPKIIFSQDLKKNSWKQLLCLLFILVPQLSYNLCTDLGCRYLVNESALHFRTQDFLTVSVLCWKSMDLQIKSSWNLLFHIFKKYLALFHNFFWVWLITLNSYFFYI